MNILFVSKDGDSMALAQRVIKEGHNAPFYTHNPQAHAIGKGLVDKVITEPLADKDGVPYKENIRAVIKKIKPDAVVFDMVKLGKIADYMKELGMNVFGSCLWADQAELNRDYGYKLMKAANINTPKSVLFKKGETEKAVAFVTENKNTRYVYKPNGNIDVSHTYVSCGVDDMVGMLELWKDDDTNFDLQEFVDGVEVSCEMWWNGFESSLHNWTMEDKKFMVDDKGPATGCMGNIVARIRKDSRLVAEGIGKMENFLKRSGYRGPIDLNSIVTKDKLYGLEFTVRFGYDAIQALMEAYRPSITKLLFDTATGKRPEYSFTQGLSIGVRISIPPYPNNGKVEQVPIIGIKAEIDKHVWLGDVMMKDGQLVCSGFDGMIGCVTSVGDNFRECRRRVYRIIDNLTIPQMQYRTDIGKRVGDNFNKLKEWGWL